MVSPVSCSRPVIEVNDTKDGTFRIRAGYPGDFNLSSEYDLRSAERIKTSLRDLGKLKVSKE